MVPDASNVHVLFGQPLTEKVALGGWDDEGGGEDVVGGGEEVVVVSGAGEGVGVTPRMFEFRSKFGVPAVTRLMAFGVATFRIAEATCDGDAVGFAERYTAATPATYGDAIEVPLQTVVAVSLVL